MKNNKLILILLAVLSLCNTVYSATVNNVKIYSASKMDVNRIICPAPVTDVIFSEEKGLVTKIVDNELFVKFPVQITINQEAQEKIVTYAEQNAELYIICEDATYNIILKPSIIPSQTIIIEADKKDTASKEILNQGKETEEILSLLIKRAIENDLPKSFQVINKNKRYDLSRGITVIYRSESIGAGYSVKEYHIYSPLETTILDTELLTFPEVNNPLAMSITSEYFLGWVRAFVIEAKNE